MAFWLGGIPDPNNNYVPSGFGADPTNPISLPPQTVAYYPSPPICASRITPFFDFDSTRLKKIQGPNSSRQPGYTCLYWPQGMVVDTTTFAENVTGAITYFRAENNMYTVTYATGAVTVSAAKTQQDMADSSNGATGVWVYPAFDTRTSATATIPHVINWINPSSVQIFSSGLDSRFGNILPPTMANGLTDSGLQFPTGENYVQPYTFDDISNFSGGKLEDAIP